MIKVMIGCHCPPSIVLKGAEGWGDRLLERERGTCAGTPIRKQGNQVGLHVLNFPGSS